MNLDFYSQDIPQCPYSNRACLWGHDDMVFCYQISGELLDFNYQPCCNGCLGGEEAVAWFRYLNGDEFVLDVK